jgi:peptidyl-prolyl cis-trans isomerase C
MHSSRLPITSFWLALLLVVPAERAGADSRDPVVVRAGRSELTQRDVERRLAALPAFQLEALGGTAGATRRRYVDEVLVPELLLDQAASEQKLEQEPAVAGRTRARLAEALVRELARGIERDRPVTEEDVRRAFDSEKESLNVPRRFRVYRILVGTEAEARRLIGEVRGTDGFTKWTTAAREQSLDKATNMRGGDLGFIRPDGSTDVPGLRVDPVLFSAAERVADGALVPDPVKENERFAVVWRRGSLPAERASFERQAPAIRQRLGRERLEAELSSLVDRLRKERVTQGAGALVDQVVVDPFHDFHASRRARVSASASASAVPGGQNPSK